MAVFIDRQPALAVAPIPSSVPALGLWQLAPLRRAEEPSADATPPADASIAVLPTEPRADVEKPTEGAIAAASGAATVSAELRYQIVAAVLIVVGLLLGWGLYEFVSTKPSQLAVGVSVFAVLYVLAQAIERFIEPFSPLLGGVLSGGVSKGTLVKKRDTKLADAKNGVGVAPKKACADAQAELDLFRANASTLAFGIAAFLALIGSGYFGFLILNLIGLSGVAAWVDLLVTGLAVGGGTKPLHDLITNLKESKNNKQDPKELQP
jgi:hypothetical protein